MALGMSRLPPGAMCLEIPFGAFRKRDCLGGFESRLRLPGASCVEGVDPLLEQLTVLIGRVSRFLQGHVEGRAEARVAIAVSENPASCVGIGDLQIQIAAVAEHAGRLVLFHEQCGQSSDVFCHPCLPVVPTENPQWSSRFLPTTIDRGRRQK